MPIARKIREEKNERPLNQVIAGTVLLAGLALKNRPDAGEVGANRWGGSNVFIEFGGFQQSRTRQTTRALNEMGPPFALSPQVMEFEDQEVLTGSAGQYEQWSTLISYY